MKTMYWQPQSVSRVALVLVAALAVSGYLVVEQWRTTVRQRYFQDKIRAARHAEAAFEVLKAARTRKRISIDPEIDPSGTGLLGTLMSPVTTNPGALVSKQTAANPNFAAIVVHFLRKAGVEEGDTVAVGYSGSFPAVNVAVLAAIEALKLNPVIIASAASSQWGANRPRFLWMHMERELLDKRLIRKGSVAASIGGIEDRGLGMSDKGRAMLERAIQRAGVQFIDPPDFRTSVEARMQIYREQAGGEIKAYVNVGGGTISVGRKFGKRLFRPGLNRRLPPGAAELDSVMSAFLKDRIPVIHLVKIADLADRFGLPVPPERTPTVGEGSVFVREEYNRWFAVILLVGLFVCLYGVAGGGRSRAAPSGGAAG